VAPRRLAAPLELGDRTLPAGVHVAPCIYLLHRRADLYPDPATWRPQRWLDGAPDGFAWIPFGGGVRRCLGASFAQFEMKVVLGTIMRHARVRAPEPREESVRRRSITFAPSSGGRIVASPA
jgi:cytochrome P450